MSSSSFSNDAFDALLAESTAANVGSGDENPTSTASKSENAFVSFDDLPVSVVEPALAAVGGFASSADEMVYLI